MMRERTLDRIENELTSAITRAVTRPPRSTAPQTAVLPTGPGRGPRGAPSNKFCGAYFQSLTEKHKTCFWDSTTTASPRCRDRTQLLDLERPAALVFPCNCYSSLRVKEPLTDKAFMLSLSSMSSVRVCPHCGRAIEPLSRTERARKAALARHAKAKQPTAKPLQTAKPKQIARPSTPTTPANPFIKPPHDARCQCATCKPPRAA